MKKVLFRIALLAVLFLLIFLLFRFTPLREFTDLSRIAEGRDQLLELVETRYTLFALLFIAVYIVAVALSIPGAVILSISGGFFFGPWLGTLYVNIGATTGSLLIFLTARLILGNSIQEKYADKLATFNHDIAANGSSYLLTLRLIPLFPFFLINLLAGVTSVKLTTFLWTTALGIIPGSFVYTYLGHAGASLEPGAADFPTEALIALVLLGLSSLIPVIVRKVRAKRKISQHTDQPIDGDGGELHDNA